MDLFHFPTNGRLRSVVLPGGQGGLFFNGVAFTRFSDASPLACGPQIHLREIGVDGVPADVDWEVGVAIPQDVDVEIRRIQLTNRSDLAREIELTTYAEIALNYPLGDAGHPAFSKLFVQTSAADGCLLAHRRPRGANESWPWMAQALVGSVRDVSWETNRATFLGRGRSVADPAAMDHRGPLSGETGNVLDPVMAWRGTVALGPLESIHVWLLTAAAADASAAQEILVSLRKENAVTALWNAAQDATSGTPRLRALAAAMLFGRTHRTVPPSMAGADVVNRHPLGWDEFRIVATGKWDTAGTIEAVAGLEFWKSIGMNVRVFVMDAAPPAHIPEHVIFTDPAEFSAEEMGWWLATAQLVADENGISGDPVLPPFARREARIAATQQAEIRSSTRHFNGYGGFSGDGCWQTRTSAASSPSAELATHGAVTAKPIA